MTYPEPGQHNPYGQQPQQPQQPSGQFQQPYGLQPYQQQSQPNYLQQPYSHAPQPQQEQGMAVASLVCSLVGLIMCFPAILGIIFGHIALAKAKRGEAGGKGMAQAGMIVGYVIVGLGLIPFLIWLFVAVIFVGTAGVSGVS